MRKLTLYLVLCLGSYGCSNGCSDFFDCEEILTDTFVINLFQNGQKIDQITGETTKNGDHIVIDHTLPDCPGLPRILPDTVKVDVLDQRTQQLLESRTVFTERNGERIELQIFVQVAPDTVSVPIVDERFIIGPGKHSATVFKLVNYKIDDTNDSEFGRNVELFKGQTEGQIEAWFRGEAGSYTFKAKVERDEGVTNIFALWIDGRQVKEWTLTGGSRDEQVVVEAQAELQSVSFIEIRARTEKTSNAGEMDFVVLERR
ncbi:MAG: hypothetical protein ACE5IY_21620 [bacterium]